MSHKLQIICCAESARPSADNRYFFPCRWLTLGRNDFSCKVCCHALQSSDINCIINHISAASGLTWMLTDKSTGCWKWIIFTNQPDSILISAFIDKRNISRYIYARRTQRHTWNRLLIIAVATAQLDMCHIFIMKANQSFVHHIGRFIANGAVSRLHNTKRGFLHLVQNLYGSSSI